MENNNKKNLEIAGKTMNSTSSEEIINSNDINKNINNGIKTLPPLYIYFLGGQGEVGKNCYCIEMGNEIFIIDAGIKFASETVTIEGIIPSFEYLIKNQSKIKGLIVTHAHEDHIGAIPHLLYQLKIPLIYTGRLAGALVDFKIRERKVQKPKVIIINNKSTIKTRNFEISFFNVIHSIPDSFGIEINTKHGKVVSTGDFRFDFSPIGVSADLYKMAKLGKENVTLLLSDSTNSEVERFAPSELVVKNKIEEIMQKTKGRLIVTTFASNVNRVREIILLAQKYNKKVGIFGWSMDKVVNISQKIKYINVSENLFVEEKKILAVKSEDLVIVCTGGQGEPFAALSKMANEKHPTIKLQKGDTVVFASNAIPGNFEAVEKLTNKLIKLGVKVYNNTNSPGVHASGHAGKLEQMLMLNLVKPKYFVPIHGEVKMLVIHGKTAVECGVNKNNIIIVPNGGRIKVVNKVVSQTTSVHAENIFVDETSLTGQSNKVISDRVRMAKNGIITVVLAISSKENKILFAPKFDSRGIFKINAKKEFITTLEQKVVNELKKYYFENNKITFSGIKENLSLTIEKEIFDSKKIVPIVLPIILNIDNVNPLSTQPHSQQSLQQREDKWTKKE